MVRRIDRLVAIQQRGIFSADEFGRLLGELITPENVDDVLKRLPSDQAATLLDAIACDHRQVADDDGLFHRTSP